MKTVKTEETGPITETCPSMPAPRDAIFSVLYYLALAVIVGAVDVEHFDQVINALIVATAGELQGELAQFKLIVKRVLVDAG